MRFAQILNNKAYWIFEAEERPKFAPNIIIVDIRNFPEVQEGWDYDAETNTFSEPVIEPAQPQPTLEEQLAEKDKQIRLLQAQNNALTERTDFHEEILTEIILTIAP